MLGFVICTVDHAIYCRGGKGEKLIVGVYVDGLLITGPVPRVLADLSRRWQPCLR
jgi:hypothetical protein